MMLIVSAAFVNWWYFSQWWDLTPVISPGFTLSVLSLWILLYRAGQRTCIAFGFPKILLTDIVFLFVPVSKESHRLV